MIQKTSGARISAEVGGKERGTQGFNEVPLSKLEDEQVTATIWRRFSGGSVPAKAAPVVSSLRKPLRSFGDTP